MKFSSTCNMLMVSLVGLQLNVIASTIFYDDFGSYGSGSVGGVDWYPKWDNNDATQRNLLSGDGTGSYAVLDTSAAKVNYHCIVKHGFSLTGSETATISTSMRYQHNAAGETPRKNKPFFSLLINTSENWWSGTLEYKAVVNRGGAIGLAHDGGGGFWVEHWLNHTTLGFSGNPSAGLSDWIVVKSTVSVQNGVYMFDTDLYQADGFTLLANGTPQVSTIAAGTTIYAGITTGWSGESNPNNEHYEFYQGNPTTEEINHISAVHIDNFSIQKVEQEAFLLSSMELVPNPEQMDRDENGLADIWEARYTALGLAASDDSDGDGISNADESLAGTNPLDALSAFKIALTNVNEDTVRVGWPSAIHREHQLQSTASLDAGWTALMSAEEGSDTWREMDLDISQTTSAFFRVTSASVDSDGDGVQDWIEQLMGSDPAEAHSAQSSTTYTDPDNPSSTVEFSGDLSAFNEVFVEQSPSNIISEAQAARFLMQATFGPRYADIQEVRTVGIEGWIDGQQALPVTGNSLTSTYMDLIYNDWKSGTFSSSLTGYSYAGSDRINGINFPTAWARVALQSEDRLRQRVAFALSQILVASSASAGLGNKPIGIADYYDLMIEYAFGNFYDLLRDVTYHPIMGTYLSHLLNEKADPSANRFPDENYAREVMQLFTIGLWELNQDGTQKVDENGEPIPTYDNGDITELAKVFTGLNYGGADGNTDWPWGWSDDWQYMQYPMVMNARNSQGQALVHDFGQKSFLGLTIPARSPSDANGDQDITDALTHLFNHDNTAPFICRQLIQFLVTANPSPAYVARVADVFDDDGSGERGNLGAVVKAILMDDEARRPIEHLSAKQFGGLREPLIRATHLSRVQRMDRYSNLVWWWWTEDVNSIENMGLQAPMRSPTVFNYYRPDYRFKGALSEQGYHAPRFQITTSYTAISFANYLWKQTNNGWGISGTNLDFDPDYSDFTALASDPTALVDRAVLLFCAGQVGSTSREIMVNAVAGLSGNTDRIKLAIYLAMMAPEGAIFK